MAGRRDLLLAKLAFDIEANTKGLQGELRSAERSFGRLTKFVYANPVAALGALAAAAIGAGVAAARMAEQFDTSVRKIAATIPEGTARLGDLKRAADQLSTSKGLSADVVLSGLAAIGKEGVTSIEALVARFEALQTVADATGTEVAALAGPFDQVLDVFGLADSELQRVGATLAAISQERGVGFEDLLGAFQSAAPVIRETGLSFDEGAAAISRLLAEGLSAKQVTAELKDQVKSLGRDGMRALATETRDAADDLAALKERARAAEESMERASNTIRNRFTARVREAGDAINTLMLKPLQQTLVVLSDPLFQGENIKQGLAVAFALATFNAQAFYTAIRSGKKAAPEVAPGSLDARRNLAQELLDALPAAPRKAPPPSPEEVQRLRDQVADTFTDTLPTTIEATVVAIGAMGQRLLDLGTPVAEVQKRLKPLTDELGRLMEASERLRDRERDADLGATTEHVEEIVGLYDTTLEQRRAILEADRAATAEQLNQIESGEELARLREELLRIEEAKAAVTPDTALAIKEAIEAERQKTEELIQQSAVGESLVRAQARLAAYDAQILRLRREQAEASGDVQEFLEDSVPPTERVAETATELARQLESLARGAIGFAQALGVADDQAAALLQNVITIGENLPKALSGDLSAIGGLLGGLAGVVSGLFGESADDRRDREIREQNTEAIRELTKTFRDQIAGSTVTGAQSAVEALLAAGPQVRGANPFAPISRGAANDIIGGLGIPGVENLRDLNELLKEIAPGLQINTSSFGDFTDSLKQVQRALEEVNFRAFAESFAGQFSLLQLQLDLLDLTNPLDQLERLRELAAGEFGAPVLESALAGLDLTDPAQRAEAERRLLELANRAGLGTDEGGFTAADLGGLSTQELLDFIRRFEGLIDAFNEEQGTTTGGGPRTESFGVERRITEVQADRLISLGVSQDAHLVEIRDLLAGGLQSFAPILPPPVPESLGFGGAATVQVGPITVTCTGPMDEDTARQAGAVLGDVAATAMARALGQRTTLARLRAGDATVRR